MAATSGRPFEPFRNIVGAAYGAMTGAEHGPFPTLADGDRGMRLLAAAVESAEAGDAPDLAKIKETMLRYGLVPVPSP